MPHSLSSSWALFLRINFRWWWAKRKAAVILGAQAFNSRCDARLSMRNSGAFAFHGVQLVAGHIWPIERWAGNREQNQKKWLTAQMNAVDKCCSHIGFYVNFVPTRRRIEMNIRSCCGLSKRYLEESLHSWTYSLGLRIISATHWTRLNVLYASCKQIFIAYNKVVRSNLIDVFIIFYAVNDCTMRFSIFCFRKLKVRTPRVLCHTKCLIN